MTAEAPPRPKLHVPRFMSPVTKAEMNRGDGAFTIEFIEDHCRIDKDSLGGRAGRLLELRDWQQYQLYRMMARSASGRRKHRVGLLGLPRKNGKSGLGSGIALSEADGGPEGGEVYACAGEKEQAGIVFRTAKRMVETDPYLSERTTVYKDVIEWKETGTIFRVLSAEAYSKEGLNPTFVLFDEVHVQPNDELWDVMALAMGARAEPMLLGITTAGDPTDRLGNDSLCYRLYQHGKKVASGEVEDPSFYFAWWEPSEGDRSDHRDPAVWAEANPGLGDLISLEDFESAVGRTHEAEFRTKRTNLWVPGKLAAIPAGKWEERAELTVPHGEMVSFGGREIDHQVPAEWLDDCVLFLDGSWSGDSTGVIGCTREGHLFTITHHERTDLDGPDWRIPVNSVMADIRLAFAHGARGLALDPHRWQQSAADLIDEGYPVVEWPTNSLARIVPAWKDFYAAIMDGEGLTHDGNPALERHMANVVLKVDAKGARPTKSAKTSRRHIDLCICAIGAWVNRNLEFGGEPTRARLWSASA